MQHRDSQVPLVLRAATNAGLPLRLPEMSMNPESDQFEQLRRLIALKRHEQPPPGYFRTFSHTVIARIEAGEGRMLEGQMSWLRRFWIALETKPVYAGAFGVAICSLLVSGVVYSSRVEEIDPGATAVIQAPTANARVQVMNSAP